MTGSDLMMNSDQLLRTAREPDVLNRADGPATSERSWRPTVDSERDVLKAAVEAERRRVEETDGLLGGLCGRR